MAETKDIKNQEIGDVNISDDVIASIAALAALEIEGVGAMTAGGVDFAELLGKKSISKGVKISSEENDTVIDLFMSVKYGAIVPSVAAKVQDAVLNAVESMAGITAKAVNVHVTGVMFEKEPKKEKTPKETEEK